MNKLTENQIETIAECVEQSAVEIWNEIVCDALGDDASKYKELCRLLARDVLLATLGFYEIDDEEYVDLPLQEQLACHRDTEAIFDEADRLSGEMVFTWE